MEEPKDKALDEVFDSALALHHEITEGTEDTASKALQDKVGETSTDITIGTINITISFLLTISSHMLVSLSPSSD